MQVSRILMNAPVPGRYRAVGRYYLALCIQRLGNGDVEQAARMIESIAKVAPPSYRVRAIQSLAGNSYHKGDYHTALSLYREAARFASSNSIYDPYATLGTQKMVAVINGEDGNHRGAVAMLENLFSLAHAIRWAQPHLYYDYMNGLAVELSEVGRLEEAKNVSQIVLASPYASAYPEWRETREEIELLGCRASRSTVAVSQRMSEAKNLRSTRGRRAADGAVSQDSFEAEKVIRLPVPEHAESLAAVETSPQAQPARVLSMQEWTERMHERSSDNLEQGRPRPATERERKARLMELSSLDAREMMWRVMTSVADDVSEDQLFRALIILEGLEPGENQGA